MDDNQSWTDCIIFAPGTVVQSLTRGLDSLGPERHLAQFGLLKLDLSHVMTLSSKKSNFFI